MKHTLYLLASALLLTTLCSCDTYVDAGARGHAHTRPGSWNSHFHRHHSQSRSDHYYSNRPSYRRSGSLLNANTNVGVRL